MATDVVPLLNENIQKSFRSRLMRDRRIAQVSKRIRDGTAKLVDAHTYAERLGLNLSNALLENLTEQTLPDGRLYYNIARRTVTPALEENYNLTNEIAADIQKIADIKNNIGLGAVKADFPKERIKGLIDKMTADDITLEAALIWLGEPIINNSEAFADDFMKANADFRKSVGLKTTITRAVAYNCCEWCANLAGTYEYGKHPRDIFKRHEFCRCTVVTQYERKSTNVWSKRSWESSNEEINRRKLVGTDKKSELTAMERVEQVKQLERDQVIKNFMEETGYDRKTAQRSTRNKTPSEIIAEINKIKERQRLLRKG